MTPELQDRVFARLADGAADQPWAFTILAALDGAAALEAYLDGTHRPESPQPAGCAAKAAAAEPPGVYVTSVTVEGFRGIGEAVTLKLPPGPGLNLVVGRNGSGKSSFAEALELLLTGRNLRWEKRAKAWQDGWRNLHHPERISLKAELLVEGQGLLTALRGWQQNGDLASSDAAVVRAGQAALPLREMGWDSALVTFRPFLSYNELGSLLEDGPSKLYDALSSVLGMEELDGISALLALARKTRQELVDGAKKSAKALAASLQAAAPSASDLRPEAAIRALKWPSPDLASLEALATGDAAAEDFASAILRQLQALRAPDLSAVAERAARLRSAEDACAAFAGTDAERSREHAELLDEALRFHRRHPGADCPVCGSPETLSGSWIGRTEAEVSRLRVEAAGCDAAKAERKKQVQEAHRMLSAPPIALSAAAPLGLGTLEEARRCCENWSRGREIGEAALLASHLEGTALELGEALAALSREAAAALERREDLWRPLALAIAEWLPNARAALAANARLDEIKEAEKWWKETVGAIRDERFAPVAEQAVAIWRQLRLRSNVDLESIELEGAAKSRKVTLGVTVDGSAAQALGVMSQGELHALALSLFLPRATLPESPFRFLWIDDPVQSMDPARVEGLARALASTARSRQVVVFTHDDRLPDAVRRLGIPATTLAVTRRAHSAVEIRPMHDPVTAHLEDARALVLTRDLPPNVAARVVPGFCRAAVEAACMEKVRRRRLERGEPHEEIEHLLAANAKIHPLATLAFFDDVSRDGDLLSRLRRSGNSVADTFQALKAGAHEGYRGDLDALIANTESLIRLVHGESA